MAIPSVKSMETRFAPASKHPRISFSHYISNQQLSSMMLIARNSRWMAYFVDQVLDKLVPRISFELALERIQEVHHAGRDDGLLHWVGGVRLGLLEVLPCIRCVSGFMQQGAPFCQCNVHCMKEFEGRT